MVKQVAIYGKGGIGKSTISSNISAALAYSGANIMQIGCDPKKDSVKLLIGEEKIVSVLEYLQKSPEIKDINEIMKIGYMGIKCIESGGPEPGVGCAGRGIILSIDILKKLGALEQDNDFIIYDVLGDVVCGGFAVPIREGYAQDIYLVVSGEFMSVFAANNICKCIKKYASAGNTRLRGIILNSRNVPDEENIVTSFASAIGTEVLKIIPRDNRFYEAEISKKTIIEMDPTSDLAQIFLTLANEIKDDKNTNIPSPLSDDELYDLYRKSGRCLR